LAGFSKRSAVRVFFIGKNIKQGVFKIRKLSSALIGVWVHLKIFKNSDL